MQKTVNFAELCKKPVNFAELSKKFLNLQKIKGKCIDFTVDFHDVLTIISQIGGND